MATFSAHEGISCHADTILASRNGAVWAGGDGGLDALREGVVTSLRSGKGLPGTQVTSLLEDHTGRLWVGVDQTLSILRSGKFTQIRRPDGQEFGFVAGIAEDVNHDVWAAISGTPRALIQIRDLQVKDVFPAPEIPAARKVAADPRGGIWLGLVDGRHGSIPARQDRDLCVSA